MRSWGNLTYCPEIEIGLGTPRETLRLTVDGRLVSRSGAADHSAAIAALPLTAGLDGYVFKAKSPSCGVHGIARYAQGDQPADRVLDVLDRALRAMGRQPRLVAAVFTSLSSPDTAAVGCQQQITLLMEGIIARAMGEPAVPDMPERARMIGHVWYSALVGWINGWSTMARVYDELAVSVRLLLPTAVARV